MSIASRINEYLTGREPAMICDPCVARALNIRDQQANQVTVALATTSDFNRTTGRCADCSKEQKVTRRV
jgi:hypothetical protein